MSLPGLGQKIDTLEVIVGFIGSRKLFYNISCLGGIDMTTLAISFGCFTRPERMIAVDGAKELGLLLAIGLTVSLIISPNLG